MSDSTLPEIPAHMVGEPISIGSTHGLVYCMRCGLLLVAPSRPELDPNRKPCRVVKVELR